MAGDLKKRRLRAANRPDHKKNPTKFQKRGPNPHNKRPNFNKGPHLNKGPHPNKKPYPNKKFPHTENKKVRFANKPIQQDEEPEIKKRKFEEPDEQDQQESLEPALKKEKKVERPPKKKFDFEQNSRTIFVGNLPTTFDHKSVAKLFKDCGPVDTARIRSIVPDKEKLAPKVALITKRLHPKVDSFNAYVVFKTNENDECVKKALAMNGKLIDKHHIRVDRAQRPNAKKETLTSRKKSVFVGNLRFDLRDDELINHFNAKIGSVSYVRIVRDSATGLGKGFGFVVFEDRASVKKALELDDTQFKGRSLRVKKVEAEDKPQKKNKKGKADGDKQKQEDK